MLGVGWASERTHTSITAGAAWMLDGSSSNSGSCSCSCRQPSEKLVMKHWAQLWLSNNTKGGCHNALVLLLQRLA